MITDNMVRLATMVQDAWNKGDDRDAAACAITLAHLVMDARTRWAPAPKVPSADYFDTDEISA